MPFPKGGPGFRFRSIRATGYRLRERLRSGGLHCRQSDRCGDCHPAAMAIIPTPHGWESHMKLIGCLLGMMIAVSSAHADDITAMISQYRREHGLPAVKTDAKLTAVAVRQAQAMAAAGVLDHDVAGSFTTRIAGANLDSA